MNVATLTSVLLWCTVINYVIITVWFFAYVGFHKGVLRLWGAWFPRMTDEQFDTATFAMIGGYKILVLFFNLIPFIVLRFIVK